MFSSALLDYRSRDQEDVRASWGAKTYDEIQGNIPSMEERYISQALRAIKSKDYPTVMLVENTALLGHNLMPPPIVQKIVQAETQIVVLTRADLFSDTALRHQIRLAQYLHPRAAIVAVSMRAATGTNKVQALVHAITGAHEHTIGRSILVCGLPNAGKSSIIYPLTMNRTIAVKKKQHYHLPKISQKAGQTLGMKNHVLDTGVSLTDMPGMRPRLVSCTPDALALMLAASVTEPFPGWDSLFDRGRVSWIPQILLEALHRYADVHSSGSLDDEENREPKYVKKFRLAQRVETPEQLLRLVKNGAAVRKLIKDCNDGKFGGLIFYDSPPALAGGNSDGLEPIILRRSSAIVYMNDLAQEYAKRFRDNFARNNR
jgi:ribosome biogenesis GTPase A